MGAGAPERWTRLEASLDDSDKSKPEFEAYETNAGAERLKTESGFG